jgi:hypothetical protein
MKNLPLTAGPHSVVKRYYLREKAAPGTPPAATPPDVPAGRTLSPPAVFTLAYCLLAALLLVHNLHLFTRPIIEEGDMAGNSLLIQKAKHFSLLVGNSSCKGFYHPGPGLLYILAGAEWLFYDLLHSVPARHNAHILGVELLYAFLLALSLAIHHGHSRSLLTTAAVLGAMLAYFAIQGQLATHWFPFMYFPLFLLFVLTTASSATGRSWHAVWMALSGCLLIHGHVCFVAFVFPMSLYGLIWLWRLSGLKAVEFLARNRLQTIAFTLVVAIFVLPIALDSFLNFPGEIGKYWEYATKRDHQASSFRAICRYVRTTFTGSADLAHPGTDVVRPSAHPLLLTLGTLGAFVVAWPPRSCRQQWRFTAHQAAVALLATLILFYYAWRGIDDLKRFTYTGIFFGAVMLVLLSSAASNAVVRLAGLVSRPGIVAVIILLVCCISGVFGRFTNTYVTSPRVSAVLGAVFHEEETSRQPLLLSVNEDWSTMATLILECNRRHLPVFVADKFNDTRYLWTANYTGGWENQISARYIDVANSHEPVDPRTRILYEDAVVSVREYDGHYRLGSVVSFAGCREAKSYKCYGWWSVEEDRTWTSGPEAKLVLNAGRPSSRDLMLSITAIPFVTPANPTLEVDVIVNGDSIDVWHFAEGEGFVDRQARVPGSTASRQSPIQVLFRFRGAKTPAEVIPGSTDIRRLGLGMRCFQLTEIAQ